MYFLTICLLLKFWLFVLFDFLSFTKILTICTFWLFVFYKNLDFLSFWLFVIILISVLSSKSQSQKVKISGWDKKSKKRVGKVRIVTKVKFQLFGYIIVENTLGMIFALKIILFRHVKKNLAIILVKNTLVPKRKKKRVKKNLNFFYQKALSVDTLKLFSTLLTGFSTFVNVGQICYD